HEQLPFTIIHKKFGTPKPHMSGKIMIAGHTAQKSHVPLNLGHAVCIDTDPGRGGWLTCLHVETDKYWQVTEAGELRESALA
ncbi:serine/threonine protein phosphatase, partial [bacterium]|nr:serine/threonine protein phosphatase [bacterium]